TSTATFGTDRAPPRNTDLRAPSLSGTERSDCRLVLTSSSWSLSLSPRTIHPHGLHNLFPTQRSTALSQTPHNLRGMLAFSSEQLMPQRFIHHLASPMRWNQPKQFGRIELCL